MTKRVDHDSVQRREITDIRRIDNAIESDRQDLIGLNALASVDRETDSFINTRKRSDKTNQT